MGGLRYWAPGFVLADEVESIESVDMKAMLAYALANVNERYNRNDAAI